MSSSTALAEAAMLQMRALQRRSLVMWSTPLVSFLVMIIFKKQVRLGVKQVMALLHGEDLKSKQNTTKVARFKKVLFETLKEHESFDPELRKEGKLLIVELMPGASSNIEYFPRGSRVIAVEAEPVFQKLYAERKHEAIFSHVKLERFVNARPEQLEGIADNSVDVVVATLVCCSVDRLDFTMREIKRVLARGGRYYFLEHEQYPDETWGYAVQRATNPLWRTCNDGCNVSRRISEAIKHVGYRKISMKKYLPAEIPYLMRPLIVGYAMK